MTEIVHYRSSTSFYSIIVKRLCALLHQVQANGVCAHVCHMRGAIILTLLSHSIFEGDDEENGDPTLKPGQKYSSRSKSARQSEARTGDMERLKREEFRRDGLQSWHY
jgi:hypothetical protein